MNKLINKLNEIKTLIFKEGRLIDRKIYSFAFEDASKESVITALRAYQNEDGGFGNGIEPDLMTPFSSAIGAETALNTLDLLGIEDEEIIQNIKTWVEKNITDIGMLPHPPKGLKEYPYEPWWDSDDDQRILSVIGLLNKFGVIINEEAMLKINEYAMKTELPEKVEMYNYPLFVYALYSSSFERRDEVLNHYERLFREFLQTNSAHYPLFSRYWYYVTSIIENEDMLIEANKFVDGIDADGGIKNPYPDLHVWRSIFTLDGILILKKYGINI